jgi:hypothetical protein
MSDQDERETSSSVRWIAGGIVVTAAHWVDASTTLTAASWRVRIGHALRRLALLVDGAETVSVHWIDPRGHVDDRDRAAALTAARHHWQWLVADLLHYAQIDSVTAEEEGK